MTAAYQGPYPSRESVTRDRIMDACVRCIAEYGLKGLRLKHIIDAAGTSRQTVYNHYANKSAIVFAAFTREGTRIAEACADEVRRYDDLEDKFVKGFLFIYENLPHNPVLNQIVLQHKEFMESLGVAEFRLEAFGRLCYAEVLAQHPRLSDNFGEIAEFWSRSVLSFLLFERKRKKSPETLEGFVRRRLVPGLALNN